MYPVVSICVYMYMYEDVNMLLQYVFIIRWVCVFCAKQTCMFVEGILVYRGVCV